MFDWFSWFLVSALLQLWYQHLRHERTGCQECRFTEKRTETPQIEVTPEQPEEKADEESSSVMPGMMPMPGMLPNMMMPGMMMPGMMMPMAGMLPTMMPAMPMMPMMAGMMPMAMSMANQATGEASETRARSRSRSRGWNFWPEIPEASVSVSLNSGQLVLKERISESFA